MVRAMVSTPAEGMMLGHAAGIPHPSAPRAGGRARDRAGPN